MVRHGILAPICAGSNPVSPASKSPVIVMRVEICTRFQNRDSG